MCLLFAVWGCLAKATVNPICDFLKDNNHNSFMAHHCWASPNPSNQMKKKENPNRNYTKAKSNHLELVQCSTSVWDSLATCPLPTCTWFASKSWPSAVVVVLCRLLNLLFFFYCCCCWFYVGTIYLFITYTPG